MENYLIDRNGVVYRFSDIRELMICNDNIKTIPKEIGGLIIYFIW